MVSNRCRPWKCFDISRSVICFLWSFHLKRRWSLRNLISRLFPVLFSNFSFNICWKPRHLSQYILFSWKPFSAANKSRWKHHRRKKRINNKINNFLKPFLRIKMPSLVSDRNLIRLNLPFDIKNIERKLLLRSVCIPNLFCFFFLRLHSTLR